MASCSGHNKAPRTGGLQRQTVLSPGLGARVWHRGGQGRFLLEALREPTAGLCDFWRGQPSSALMAVGPPSSPCPHCHSMALSCVSLGVSLVRKQPLDLGPILTLPDLIVNNDFCKDLLLSWVAFGGSGGCEFRAHYSLSAVRSLSPHRSPDLQMTDLRLRATHLWQVRLEARVRAVSPALPRPQGSRRMEPVLCLESMGSCRRSPAGARIQCDDLVSPARAGEHRRGCCHHSLHACAVSEWPQCSGQKGPRLSQGRAPACRRGVGESGQGGRGAASTLDSSTEPPRVTRFLLSRSFF